MRLPRASLVRRLTLAYILGHTIALFIFLVSLVPLVRDDDVDQIGPGVVIAMLREDLVETPAALTLRPGNSFEAFARTTPGVWFVARKGTRALRWGPVPAQATEVLGNLPPVTILADFGNIGATGRAGDMEVARGDADPNSLLLAAGGVRAEAVTFGTWLGYLHRELYLFMPLLSALFSLMGALIAIPLVLRSVRPTVRAAAALDPTDPAQRLPERKVVKELLPLVRAFNGALERLEAGFERRRRFIADVAHELRTPLAILNMHVEALPNSAPKPDLQRTVFRLGQMVGQMLDSERLALAARRREPVDLVALAKATVADIAPLAVASGYEMAFSSEREQVTVEADGHAVARAIANLLGNSVAHGGNSGTIEVHVGRGGRIDVADGGPGVPVEARERIFEPFHRERWDRDGCGLGLHLVREIMHAHGGEVRLIGSGPGSLFRLEFPAARVEGGG
ncbi:MAG TPA: HAMP domain-containing sensor histidine kinase [Allosphingosinicella sp.]|jgi:signal transduction histidine kinase